MCMDCVRREVPKYVERIEHDINQLLEDARSDTLPSMVAESVDDLVHTMTALKGIVHLCSEIRDPHDLVASLVILSAMTYLKSPEEVHGMCKLMVKFLECDTVIIDGLKHEGETVH